MENAETDIQWTEERAKRYADDVFDISENEIFWIAHQRFLESHGYLLRPRYRPGWVKSWTSTPDDSVEEAICVTVSHISSLCYVHLQTHVEIDASLTHGCDPHFRWPQSHLETRW